MAEDDETAQERKSARTRHEQRVQCRRARPGLAMAVADQEKRRDRRELPAHVQDDDLVGLDQEQHRATEEHDQPGQTPQVAGVRREVAGGVQQDDDTDARDDQGHRRRQPVEPQVDRQSEIADPGELRRGRSAAGHVGKLQAHPRSRGHGHRGRDEERASTQPFAERDEREPDDRERGERDDHRPRVSFDVTNASPTARRSDARCRSRSHIPARARSP